MTEYRSAGKTTLTPDVLLTIARMAALEVEGVKRMAPVKGGVNSLFGRGNEGVRMIVEDSNVLVDLYLVLESDVNIREVSRTVQQTVARAIAEMTGLEVGHVNIHIEDIDYVVEA
ncbi:MAG TPA: Asp23/Gls24 family envelope stress response protein [Anaerolineales bacterium]|nr:Asp23/Gls24 family envelope stress response protein [Anaerolineales bacterium]